ncbi:MAG: nucleotidyltransferase family protein, partial [Deltaproteobacteria bacterium]|nr:nucleotidyltransferase family protein [Deltaproteobacteria bacterium]
LTLPSHGLGVEDRVLLCSAHPQVTPERYEQLTKLLASVLDWEQIVALAERHEIVPLLSRYLHAVPLEMVPDTVRKTLAVLMRENLVRNLYLQQELLRVLAALNQAALPVMPLKGPWLSELLYGDVTLRMTGDLDLLVRPHDLEAAEQILQELGYRRGRPREHEEESYHYTFVSDDRRALPVTVELHWDIVRAHIARRDMAEVWSGATRGEWHGREIWTMAPPDLFLILCQNAAKDTFGFLKQLVDVALVIERWGATWSWAALAHTIRTARMRTRVYLTVSLTRQLLGSQVPADFLAAIRPPPGISWHVGQTLLRWRGGVLHTARADVGPPFNPILTLLWEDSWRGKVRHLRRLIFPSASYQARWTGQSPATSLWRRYPLWLSQVFGHFFRFLPHFGIRHTSNKSHCVEK